MSGHWEEIPLEALEGEWYALEYTYELTPEGLMAAAFLQYDDLPEENALDKLKKHLSSGELLDDPVTLDVYPAGKYIVARLTTEQPAADGKLPECPYCGKGRWYLFGESVECIECGHVIYDLAVVEAVHKWSVDDDSWIETYGNDDMDDIPF